MLTSESGLEIEAACMYANKKFPLATRYSAREMKMLKVSRCHEDSPDFRTGLVQMEVLRHSLMSLSLTAYQQLSYDIHY